MKKVGKTTTPFRYDLNQIPYNSGCDKQIQGILSDRVPEELWTEVRNIVQEVVIKTFPKKKKCKKAKWLSEEVYKELRKETVMCKCESWTIKKAERQSSDAFELWFWSRFSRVPFTTRSNQSILKVINPEYSLEGLMLKLQYFGHLIERVHSLEKTLILGKTEDRRRKG